MTIKLLFSSEEIETLQQQRFSHPSPRVQRKMDVLVFKAHGVPQQQISAISGVCENTVRVYLKAYQAGGIEELQREHFYKPQGALFSVTEDLKTYFESHPPATIKQAAAEIEKLTGIKRGLTQVRKFVRSIGMQRRQTGSVPAKADVEIQEVFKKEKLDPALNEARSGERLVFFVDAAHFVLAPFLGFLWCFTRLFVKAPSGRQRFNVLGALNAVTHELITITNDAYINSQSVCALIQKIVNQSIGKPITLVLDNARYQRCVLVSEFAKSLGVELLFLPPYSPNLNLIERMWKFTKKQCLNSKFYSDFQSFSNAIATFIQNVHIEHKEELNSLLTHRFQDLGKMKIILTG
jgi:transposase